MLSLGVPNANIESSLGLDSDVFDKEEAERTGQGGSHSVCFALDGLFAVFHRIDVAEAVDFRYCTVTVFRSCTLNTFVVSDVFYITHTCLRVVTFGNTDTPHGRERWGCSNIDMIIIAVCIFIDAIHN